MKMLYHIFRLEYHNIVCCIGGLGFKFLFLMAPWAAGDLVWVKLPGYEVITINESGGRVRSKRPKICR